MSYSITTYLFYGLPLTEDEEVEYLEKEEELRARGLCLHSSGCMATGEGHVAHIVSQWVEAEHWCLRLDSLKAKPEGHVALLAMRELLETKDEPAWFLGRMGG